MNYASKLFNGTFSIEEIFYPRYGCSIVSAVSLIFLIILFISTVIKNKIQKRKQRYEPNALISDDTTQEITESHWLIFLIAISEFIGCIAIIIYKPNKNDKDDPTTLCQVQGCLSTFCEITTICFSSVLSYWIFQLSKGDMTINDVQAGKVLWILYGYLPGLLFTIIPLFLKRKNTDSLNIYGLSGYWCWIGFKEETPFQDMFAENIYTFVFYIFTWLNLIFSIGAMISSIARFSSTAKKVEEQNEEGFQRIKFFCDFIFYFPFIRVIGWLIPTANRIFGLCTEGDNKLLYIAHGISMSIVGFLSSIVFFVYQFKSFVYKEGDQKDAKSTDNEIDVDLYPEDD